jgi:hypothetical protein
MTSCKYHQPPCQTVTAVSVTHGHKLVLMTNPSKTVTGVSVIHGNELVLMTNPSIPCQTVTSVSVIHGHQLTLMTNPPIPLPNGFFLSQTGECHVISKCVCDIFPRRSYMLDILNQATDLVFTTREGTWTPLWHRQSTNG